MIVDIEANAKELAVVKLMTELKRGDGTELDNLMEFRGTEY